MSKPPGVEPKSAPTPATAHPSCGSFSPFSSPLFPLLTCTLWLDRALPLLSFERWLALSAMQPTTPAVPLSAGLWLPLPVMARAAVPRSCAVALVLKCSSTCENSMACDLKMRLTSPSTIRKTVPRRRLCVSMSTSRARNDRNVEAAMSAVALSFITHPNHLLRRATATSCCTSSSISRALAALAAGNIRGSRRSCAESSAADSVSTLCPIKRGVCGCGCAGNSSRYPRSCDANEISRRCLFCVYIHAHESVEMSLECVSTIIATNQLEMSLECWTCQLELKMSLY